MINRVLIRMKVVQLLYSYLISDGTFSIEQPSENPTREKRFAYQAYIALLALMVKGSGLIAKRGGHSPLSETRFIKVLKSDDRVSSFQRRAAHDVEFCSVAENVADDIKESAIYKRYIKEGESNQRIWNDIFKYIISVNPVWQKYAAGLENHTLHGMERVREMLENTLSNFYGSSDNLAEARNSLRRSMDQARKLYVRLLSLPCAIVHQREADLEENRTKYLRTAEDVNPNMRFVENKLVALLNGDDQLEKELEADSSLRWLPDDFMIVRKLLKAIMQSELYRDYMGAEKAPTLEDDAEFWREAYKKIIFNNQDFLTELEDKSVFWNNDLDIVGEFLLKTLRRYGVKGRTATGLVDSQMMPMYKDAEDERFGDELFSHVLRNRVEYKNYITEAVAGTNWDAERLALMDIVIVMAALAEITAFPAIPVQVSVNEYVEIAKEYSTPKSSGFVHGVLGTIIAKMKEEGKIRK